MTIIKTNLPAQTEQKPKEQYLLFAGSTYYPRGGYEDLVLVSNDIHELKFRFQEMQEESGSDKWGHIVRQSDNVVIEVIEQRNQKYAWRPGPQPWSTDWPTDRQSTDYVEVEYRNGSRETAEIIEINWERYNEDDKWHSPTQEEEVMRFRYVNN